MALISVDDVTTYMGGGDTLTPRQKEFVEDFIIPGVQEQLEKHLNTTVELVQVRESLTPGLDGYVYFTYAPVRRIISAVWSQTGAVPVNVGQYVPDPYVVDPSITRPVIDRTAISTASDGYRYQTGFAGIPGLLIGPPQYMVFDYIAGYDGTQDQGLMLDMLRVIAREVEHQFNTSAGVRSGTIDAISEADTRVKGWTADELASLNRLRRRVIV